MHPYKYLYHLIDVLTPCIGFNTTEAHALLSMYFAQDRNLKMLAYALFVVLHINDTA